MRELENMPNHYMHTIYKEYVNMLKDESKQQALAGESVIDELAGN